MPAAGKHQPPSKHKVFRVLFIRIDRIGDMVLSTPVFRLFKNYFPNSIVEVLASAANKAILENNPYVDTTLVYPQSRDVLSRIIWILKLRRKNYQMVFDLHADYTLFTAIVAFLVGKRQRVGFKYCGREIFINYTIDIPTEKDFIAMTASLLNELGVNEDEKQPDLYISPTEQSWAETWLRAHFQESKPMLGIHPGAYYETQKWPARYHAELVQKLNEAGDFNLILFGAASDISMVRRILDFCNSPIEVFISNDLRKFGALLARQNIFICNNSGPLHMASALGIKTISFMGPTNATLWTPRGASHTVLRRNELDCIGCNRGDCKIGTHDCMRLITSDQVYRAIVSSQYE